MSTNSSTLGDTVQRSAIVTHDVAVATAIIQRLYADARVELGRPGEDYEFRLAHASAGPLSISTVRYGFEGRAEVAPVDTFTTVVVQAGSLSVASGAEPETTMGSGEVWRWNTNQELRAGYGPESAFVLQQLPLTTIDEAAAESGRAGATDTTAAAVRFLDTAPVDAAGQQYWAGLVRFAYQQATAPDSPLNSPLVRAQLVRTLAQAALVTFPNTTMTTDYLAGPGDVGPATLRRALAHLHAHAAEPLTVGDLAGAAGIGVRALQQAFTTQLGATPMTHLRRVRLERAHADLRAGDPTAGDTVAAIAARWGFAHPGRFAAAYQTEYEVSPATTLRR
ncbi:AraC family transcriptional regulator [Kineococcus rubinsiae]|uniref:AraC family transcriptional regulator n=1 Tax=Kineococcus rubinsiae TaxID=2609562 RepID=UPI0014308E6A|nr:AraC family transcriptional regulator [Kineococcus rubinsiae]NIZ89654.1 AraC family transcriptional regulator [Kineococcus rubinsiae]